MCVCVCARRSVLECIPSTLDVVVVSWHFVYAAAPPAAHEALRAASPAPRARRLWRPIAGERQRLVLQSVL